MIHDITDRKLVERALMESEVRFRIIADAVPQLIWTNGPDGAVHYMNTRWYDFTGMYQQGTLDWGWADVLHPDDVERVATEWRRCLASGEPLGLEARLRRASDGTYRSFVMHSVPVRDDQDTITQWIGTCTDINDQKHAMALDAARVEAESANRAKSEFLANMSHEIRTPMAAILGYADLLLDPEQTPSDRHKAINVIRRNGVHLLAVINDILDLSKIEAGEMKVERVACSPCQIMADVASLMRVRAVEKGLMFELKVDGRIPEMIECDPTRLRQILLNLASNAVKFTECGWVRLVARLIDPPESAAPRICFEVIDTGIGIEHDQIALLFQPFVQLDTSARRSFGGTGLGLAISRRLATAMAGEITVDSTPGRGSLFALTIPTGPLAGVKLLCDCSEALSSLDRTSLTRSPSEIQLIGRILIAEDGIDNQELLSAYLRHAGADVVTAGNGKIACQLVVDATANPRTRDFDLIIMDMQMPVLDGYGAAALLRSKGFAGPIIALTAHAMSTDRDKCLQAGCTDYLAKPVKRDHFLSTIARHLEAVGRIANDIERGVAPDEDSPDAVEADEILDALLPRFLDRLPNEASRLEELLNERLLGELASAAHKLCGAAGMYRFADLSSAAGTLEKSVLEGATFDEITPQVLALIEMIRAVQPDGRARRR